MNNLNDTKKISLEKVLGKKEPAEGMINSKNDMIFKFKESIIKNFY